MEELDNHAIAMKQRGKRREKEIWTSDDMRRTYIHGAQIPSIISDDEFEKAIDGDFVSVGTMAGVALNSVKAGEMVSISTSGTIALNKEEEDGCI